MKKNARLVILSFCMAVGSFSCWDDSRSRRDRNTSSREIYNANISSESNSGDRVNANTMNTDKKNSTGFEANLPTGFRQPSDEAGRKLLREYGAIFVARGGAVPPTTVVFKDEAEVSAFQSRLQTSSESIGGFTMELQAPAMTALKAAIAEAKQNGLSITPRDVDSAKRNYNETIELWNSRVDPALEHWVGKGRVSQADADRIKALSPYEQVPEIFKLEAQGIYFAKDLSKSIIYSVAPPGTSQHLAMLALDVKEYEDAKVRDVLAKHGWYQTVISDLPHFTFLGVSESELAGLGLKRESSGGRSFWIPAI